MDTREFGPPMWKTMFIIAANYELQIDPKNKKHLKKKKIYKKYFTDIKDIIPCIHCRRSYKVFLKELPINKFLNSRKELMYWLYLIKDKVNKKLIKQYKQGLYKYKTKPSPSFSSICKHYEQFRASCSGSKSVSCTKPTNSMNL